MGGRASPRLDRGASSAPNRARQMSTSAGLRPKLDSFNVIDLACKLLYSLDKCELRHGGLGTDANVTETGEELALI